MKAHVQSRKTYQIIDGWQACGAFMEFCSEQRERWEWFQWLVTQLTLAPGIIVLRQRARPIIGHHKEDGYIETPLFDKLLDTKQDNDRLYGIQCSRRTFPAIDDIRAHSQRFRRGSHFEGDQPTVQMLQTAKCVDILIIEALERILIEEQVEVMKKSTCMLPMETAMALYESDCDAFKSYVLLHSLRVCPALLAWENSNTQKKNCVLLSRCLQEKWLPTSVEEQLSISWALYQCSWRGRKLWDLYESEWLQSFDTICQKLLHTTILNDGLTQNHGNTYILPPLLKAFIGSCPQPHGQRVLLFAASNDFKCNGFGNLYTNE